MRDAVIAPLFDRYRQFYGQESLKAPSRATLTTGAAAQA